MAEVIEPDRSRIEDILMNEDVEEPLSRIEQLLIENNVSNILKAGTNILITKNDDGTLTISASGEVSSEDTVAREAITAMKDGTSLDSFGDVETALSGKQDTIDDLSDIRTGAGKGATAVQPESGKGLSTNDFTDTLKTKLDGIAAGAEVNVQANWEQTDNTADDYIKNKPTIPAAQVNSDWNAASGVAQILNKPTLGTAAAAATTDFATAAQGTKADSAIQGVKVGSTTLTPDSGKAVTITKNDITGLGIPAQDTTYVFEGTYNASTNKAATMADIKDGVLTGYAQSSGNVAATDKVIEAIGKVEKKADTNESNISNVQTSLAVGSSDDGKVLTASYSGGTGSYAWVTQSGGDVTGVKGSGETNYRTGNVSLSAANVGAIPTTEKGANGGVAALDSNGKIAADKIAAGALANGMTATTQETSDDSTKLATTAFVHDVVDSLPSPMVYKGTLGTGGTITTLPVDGTAEVGDTYKVITAGTYASQAAKIGDMFICLTKATSSNTWSYVPSGDDTDVTQVSAGTGLTTASGSPITTTGTIKAKLKSSTALAEAATNSTTTGKSYAVNVDSAGDLACNVPWTDTTYTFNTAYNASTNKAATMSDITTSAENGTLTGYEKKTGNVAATDKIVEAIGKLETKADTNKNNILSTCCVGTCTTSGNVAAKIVTIDDANWTLRKGCIIAVKFSNSNSVNDTESTPITLNVNNTGAYRIWYKNGAYANASQGKIFGYAGYYVYYMFDGVDRWLWVNYSMDNTYSTMSQSEASAGTSTNEHLITAKVLSDTIDEKLVPVETNISKITPTTTYKTNHAFQSANYELINDVYINVPDGKRIFLVVGAKQANVTGVAVCFNTQTYDATKIVISQEVSSAQQMISCAGCYDNGNGGQNYRLSVFAKGVAGSQLNCRVTLSWWYL